MEWNADQLALREGLSRWHDRLSADHIEQDAEGAFPWDKWTLVRESGILGLLIDERWRGLGQDLLTTMYVLEALGEGCRDGGLSFSATTSMVSTGVPLQRFGSDRLRDAHLPRIASGAAIGAHAISEPDAGSDTLAMRTSAVRDGEWSTNVIGRVGGGFMVLDHVMKHEILCSFVVDVGEMQRRLDHCRDYARTRIASALGL